MKKDRPWYYTHPRCEHCGRSELWEEKRTKVEGAVILSRRCYHCNKLTHLRIDKHGAVLDGLGFPAYHGSPHDFDKFSLHKVGTGEGAQAFGFGLYFAGDKALAEHYRHQLTGGGDRGLFVDGVPFREFHPPPRMAVAMVRVEAAFRGSPTGTTAQQALKRAIENSEREADELQAEIDAGIAAGKFTGEDALEELKLVADARREAVLLRSVDPSTLSFKHLGQTYKVEIPEPEELLDYDKPLTEQPPGVLAKLLKSGLLEITPKHRYAFTGGVDIGPEGTVTGKAFYGALIQAHSVTITTDLDVRSAAEWASKKLLQAGIPGMRYLDRASRGKGDGFHNYVIWDDQRIEVKEKLHGLGSARRWMRTPGGR